MPKWLINGGDPNYLLNGMILQAGSQNLVTTRWPEIPKCNLHLGICYSKGIVWVFGKTQNLGRNFQHVFSLQKNWFPKNPIWGIGVFFFWLPTWLTFSCPFTFSGRPLKHLRYPRHFCATSKRPVFLGLWQPRGKAERRGGDSWSWSYTSGQMTIVPKPELRGLGGNSLTTPPFGVTSAEVAIICSDTWICLFYAWKKVQTYFPKWWFDGDLPWCNP